MNHFTVYKITNQINGKVYIGKHHCTCGETCLYMGSGKLIKAAIKKHGKESFKKEILFVFETEDEMNKKEAEIVTEEFIASGVSYNLCPGGQGGWGYVNDVVWDSSSRIKHNKNVTPFKSSDFHEAYREAYKKGNATLRKIGKSCTDGFKGKHHNDESRRKIGLAATENQKGSKNSQFGTMWITNGAENKKIKKDLDKIPEGWYKGYKPKAAKRTNALSRRAFLGLKQVETSIT